MKNKLQILAGGLAAVLVPVAVLVAYLAYDGDDEPVASPIIEPVPAPAMEPALATTHREVTPPAPPPVVEAPDPYVPELATSGAIQLRRLIVATGVSGHEPTGAADSFEIGAQDRLYAFVEAVNASGDPVELEVTFEPAHGESVGHIALEVPRTRRWRTWAFTRHVYTEGRWEAVVRAPDGRVIGRRAFDVTR